VREDDRVAGYFDDVEERFIRNVGEVDDHPEPVHLADHLPAEVVQPVPARSTRARIGPAVADVVRQGHRGDAELMEFPEKVQPVLDRMAALDGQGDGDFSRRDDALDVGSGPGQLHRALIPVDGHLHGFEELECLAGGLVRIEIVLDEKGHHLDVHASFLEPRNVDMARRQPFSDVQSLIKDTVGQVIMAVPDAGLPVELIRGIFTGSGKRNQHQKASERTPAIQIFWNLVHFFSPGLDKVKLHYLDNGRPRQI